MGKVINIVGDLDGVVTYEEVVTDTINRAEVEELESKISSNRELIEKLQAENSDIFERLEYAKRIIALADELSQAQAETEPEDTVFAENQEV